MPEFGYCTTLDVRKALQEKELTGDLAEEFVEPAITSQAAYIEKTTKRHWYDPDADSGGILPTDVQTRDDEHDITTGGVSVSGEPVAPKTWNQDYTKIRFDRKDVQTVNQLLVAGGDGYADWVDSSEYEGGPWPDSLGDDYYVRINNEGWTELYLDTTHFYDAENEEWILDTFSNAVYVDLDYGKEGIPDEVTRAAAFLAGAQLIRDDDTQVGIPDSGQLVDLETKADALERNAEDLLDLYRK